VISETTSVKRFNSSNIYGRLDSRCPHLPVSI